MLAQANEVEYKVAQEDSEHNSYGGIEDATNSLLTSINVDQRIERLYRDRASRTLRVTGESSPKALVEIADIHFNHGAYNRAFKAYIKSLKLDPDNISTYLKIIRTLIIQSKADDADKFYLQLLEKTNFNNKYIVEYLNFKIVAYINDGMKDEKAHALINNHIDNATRDPNVLNVLALYKLVVEKNIDATKSILTKALVYAPKDVHLNNNLGLCYKIEKQYDKAEKFLTKAHFLDLFYPAAYENLASTYMLQNKKDKAFTILENAEQNNIILESQWRHLLAYLYIDIDNHASIARYKKLALEEPDNPLILNNLGVNYLRVGDKTKAGKLFIKSVNLVKKGVSNGIIYNEKASTPFNNLFRFYRDEDRGKDALSVARSSQKLFPSDNISFHQEALIHIENGRMDDAKKCLELSLELNPNHAESIVNYSFVLEDFYFEYQKAIDILLPHINNYEGEMRTIMFNNIAFAYIKTGNLIDAKKYILDSDHSYASFATKGLLNLLEGNHKLSKELYRRAFKEAKNDSRLDLTKQFYFYEHAIYWQEKKDNAKAAKYAKDGLKYNANPKISNLLRQLLDRII